jgi:hypothetical protein
MILPAGGLGVSPSLKSPKTGVHRGLINTSSAVLIYMTIDKIISILKGEGPVNIINGVKPRMPQ